MPNSRYCPGGMVTQISKFAYPVSVPHQRHALAHHRPTPFSVGTNGRTLTFASNTPVRVALYPVQVGTKIFGMTLSISG